MLDPDQAEAAIATLGPASRQFVSGARPIYVVGIYNLSAAPVEFRVANIDATQVVNGEASTLKVITYEQLVTEDRNRLETLLSAAMKRPRVVP